MSDEKPLSFGSCPRCTAVIGTCIHTDSQASGAAGPGHTGPCCRDTDSDGVPATLVCNPLCIHAPGRKAAAAGLCRCGQRLVNGVCHCGNTPVTQRVTLTLDECRAIHGMAIAEQSELFIEHRVLTRARNTNGDDSWSARLSEIERRQGVLREIILKVRS